MSIIIEFQTSVVKRTTARVQKTSLASKPLRDRCSDKIAHSQNEMKRPNFQTWSFVVHGICNGEIVFLEGNVPCVIVTPPFRHRGFNVSSKFGEAIVATIEEITRSISASWINRI
jgi:hypothetical protein